MAAHRRSDRRRVYLCAGGLRKGAWDVGFIDWLDAGTRSQRANVINARKAILRRPSAPHRPFSDRPGLSQSPAPEQRQSTAPSVKHIGPNATAMGRKCSPTIKRLANRAERSPALRYLGIPKRNNTISSTMDPNKNHS